MNTLNTTNNLHKFLRHYCQQMGLALFKLTIDGYIVEVSENTYSLFGIHTRTNLTNKHIFDILLMFGIKHDLFIGNNSLKKQGVNPLLSLTPSLKEDNSIEFLFLTIDIDLSEKHYSISPYLSDNIPYPIFCKDINGEYAWANKSLDDYARKAVSGLNDLDLPWGAIAQPLINNDKTVLTEDRTLIALEQSINKERNKQLAYSVKAPVYSKDSDKVIAVIGVSIFNCHQSIINAEGHSQLEISSGLNLSKREVECVNLLIQGFTAAKIAKTLLISKRTVEDHIKNIKIKMNCSNLFKLGYTFGKYFTHLLDH